MAVTSFRRSGLTSLIKYDRFTAGNESDFALIASQTVGSGGASSITFSNIPQGFRHLQVRAMIRAGVNDAGIGARINSDTGSNYACHVLFGTGSSTGSTASTSANRIWRIAYAQDQSSTTHPGVAVIDILDYADTSKNTTLRSLWGVDHNGFGTVGLSSGLWVSTSAVTSVQFFTITGAAPGTITGNFSQHATFSLYGVR